MEPNLLVPNHKRMSAKILMDGLGITEKGLSGLKLRANCEISLVQANSDINDVQIYNSLDPQNGPRSLCTYLIKKVYFVRFNILLLNSLIV